ncbi:hypothetical protein CC86DRAFT_366310 [Ophiobolus disseminans]|uniref:Uncharacterized protein n=1 Tax=Ophiobolus disseminans TaxID=1469910 RepID=A0A6A7AHC1_9PLEO|nr:hypothetical protein CC86DRAFT_366310 [Ophiobolus disseminans]
MWFQLLVLPAILGTLVSSAPAPFPPGYWDKPECPGSDATPSRLPTNVFYLAPANKGVFDEFCKQMDNNNLDDRVVHKWTVNARGEKQPGWSKNKRAPPPNPNSHSQMIHLNWTPKLGTTHCNLSCHTAFADIAQSQCGSTGGQGYNMAVKALHHVGCGTFRYEITG